MIPELSLNPDGSLTLPGGTYNARQLDTLIEQLGLLRSRMRPQVPAVLEGSATVLPERDPAVQIGLSADHRLLLALRHSGLGWCVFDINKRDAARLQEFITKRTEAMGELTGKTRH